MPDRTPDIGRVVEMPSGECGEIPTDHKPTPDAIRVRLDSGREPRYSNVEPVSPNRETTSQQ